MSFPSGNKKQEDLKVEAQQSHNLEQAENLLHELIRHLARKAAEADFELSKKQLSNSSSNDWE